MKAILLLLYILVCTSAVAQESKFDFGFFVGATQRLNRIDPNVDENYNIEARNNLGIDAGATFYYQATASIKARASLAAHYESDELVYSGPTFSTSSRLNALYLSSGLHALIKPGEQSRLQLVTGITPHSRLQNEPGQNGLGFSKFDLSADIGLAFELPVRNIKVSPELRYGRSLTNVGAGQEGRAALVNSYYRDRLSVSFYFSGF